MRPFAPFRPRVEPPDSASLRQLVHGPFGRDERGIAGFDDALPQQHLLLVRQVRGVRQ